MKTLNDKIQTMGQNSVSGNYSDQTPLVAREYVWWSESLHGLFPIQEQYGVCGKFVLHRLLKRMP
jgi:hypothetical protein